ncbi:MAG: 2,3-bisphosphoglycerate-independent phosphoglycerate mutase [Patescibacteria group bacterium]
MATRPKPIVLAILDGWGVAPASEGNAVTQAKTPVINKLITTYPAMTLHASSEEVGLQFGEMGNSEVGHLNLGVGKVVYQNLPRISRNITEGSFFKNPILLKAIEHAKKNKSKLHLVGLTSSGGVHSHIEHLYALLDLAKQEKIDQVYIHAFLDGRDTIYNVGIDYIKELQKRLKKNKVGQIATLSGRFYSMDRDNHWERIEQVYKAMSLGESVEKFDDPVEAIEKSYQKKVYDEEFVPVVITHKDQPVGKIEDNDAVIFFNFRADRGRELTKAYVLPDFDKFPRIYLPNLFFATMMEYEKDLPVEVAYPPENVETPLARVIAEAGLKQLHIAETEKYVHVTFFFNGLKDIKYPGEDQVVIPSPRVSSYAQKPEMSAQEVANQIVQAIKKDKYDFILVNFANPDMVAHTGELQPTIECIEVVDRCLGQIVDLTLAKGGVVLVVADHGNAEELINLQTGEIDKEHSTNPVPFIIVGKPWEGQTAGLPDGVGTDLSLVAPQGVLSDVAPTVLKIMGLNKPKDMTGSSLI